MLVISFCFLITINPQLTSPPPPCGRLFILTPVEGGGLIETAGLVHLKKAMVSLLHKELEYKLEKLKYKKSSSRGTQRGCSSKPLNIALLYVF